VESLETGRRGRDDLAVAGAMINLGSGAGEIRRYVTARRWLVECIEFCRTRDLDFTRSYATSWLARVALETGDWDQAQALAADVLTTDTPIALLTALTVTGRIACRRGEASASELLERAWEIASRTGDLQRTWPVAAGRAEAAWLVGRPEEVQLLVGPVLDEAVRLDQPWAIGELGWWWTRTGGTHPAPDRAAAPYALLDAGDWRAAARTWDDLGCPYEAALARAEGDDPEELAAASACLHRLGARADAARVAQRMRSLGLPVAARPRRATATNPAGLTDRELEVARLLSTGATNNDIAAALFISPRTTAHHVSAVLAKLGVRTRREAGPALAEHGHR
jgi:DNA-binding CsgD family transcriptional regulator